MHFNMSLTKITSSRLFLPFIGLIVLVLAMEPVMRFVGDCMVIITRLMILKEIRSKDIMAALMPMLEPVEAGVRKTVCSAWDQVQSALDEINAADTNKRQQHEDAIKAVTLMHQNTVKVDKDRQDELAFENEGLKPQTADLEKEKTNIYDKYVELAAADAGLRVELGVTLKKEGLNDISAEDFNRVGVRRLIRAFKEREAVTKEEKEEICVGSKALSQQIGELQEANAALVRQITSKDAVIDQIVDLEKQRGALEEQLLIAQGANERLLNERVAEAARVEAERQAFVDSLEEVMNYGEGKSEEVEMLRAQVQVLEGGIEATHEPVHDDAPNEAPVPESSNEREYLHEPTTIVPEVVRNGLVEGVDDYLARGMGEQLGVGTFGAVRVWRNPASNALVRPQVLAAKVLNIAELTQGSAWPVQDPVIRRRIHSAGASMVDGARLLLLVFRGVDHIVPCHLFRTHEDGINMTMLLERMDGTAEDLRRHGLMDERVGLDFVEHCSRGLSEVHQRGVVHLDIKPDNIGFRTLPNGTYQFVLLDFGIAARLNRINVNQQSGGTPMYMAPEIHRHRHFSPQADVYSLFVSLADVFDFNRVVTRIDAEEDAEGDAHQMDVDKIQLWFREAAAQEVRATDWADMAAEDPMDRPSSANLVKRAELLRLAGRERTECAALWSTDRVGRTGAIFNGLQRMQQIQGLSMQEVVEILRPHSVLIPGMIETSD